MQMMLRDQSSVVLTLQGAHVVHQVLDDIDQTLGSTGGNVYLSGIDERRLLESDPEGITARRRMLAKKNIQEHILTRSGNTAFSPEIASSYRWVPDHFFNPTPICIYGDKVAMILWGFPNQAVIIQDFALADAHRKQFLWTWQHAVVPPTTSANSERKRLEEAVMKRFGGRVSPTTQKDQRLFRDFRAVDTTQTYGNSFYYVCQAANGTGPDRLGLKYFDGEMLAGIGIFNRSSFEGGWHYHIINPMGQFDPERLRVLARGMRELSGAPVFVKKLTAEEQQALLQIGFSRIEEYPWHAQAIEEDDTFPEQIVDVQATLDRIAASGRCDLKEKYKRFMSKYGSATTFEPLGAENADEAHQVVNQFFEYLEIKELHISQPTDYDNIIHYPPLGKNGKSYFSELIRIGQKPAGLYAMEPVSEDTAGLFANITLHQEFPYLSEYLIVRCCEVLQQAGYRFLNLGGSETSGLFSFKEKALPIAYNKMYWVVYKA